MLSVFPDGTQAPCLHTAMSLIKEKWAQYLVEAQ